MRICDFCKSSDRVSQCYISLGRMLIGKYDQLDGEEKVIADLHSDTESIRPELCLKCRSEVARRLSRLMHDVRTSFLPQALPPGWVETKSFTLE